MITVQAFINTVRNRVGDKNGNKFTDDRIIELINEGLKDLAKKAYVNKKQMNIPIVPYTRALVIPDDNFIKLQRIRCNSVDLEKYTHDEMDKRFNKWEDKIGSKLDAIVYDLKNPKTIILFPLLDETSANYEALNASDSLLIDIPNVESDSAYGLITSIDTDDIIVPENVYDETELQGYEPILNLSDTFITVSINYYAFPDKADIDNITAKLDLDSSYHTTLLYYVAGTLLLDDNRTEGIARGQIFLQKYAMELKTDIDRTSNSYQSVDYPEIPYRTGF